MDQTSPVLNGRVEVVVANIVGINLDKVGLKDSSKKTRPVLAVGGIPTTNHHPLQFKLDFENMIHVRYDK